MQKKGKNYICALKQKPKHKGWCTVQPHYYRYKYSKHFFIEITCVPQQTLNHL